MAYDDFKKMPRDVWGNASMYTAEVTKEQKEMTERLRAMMDTGEDTISYRQAFPRKEYVLPATGTEGKVCDDIAARQRMGVNKYGTTVCANPLELRQWLQHAYEEALDQAIYLKRAIQELDKNA